jgi:hypothetical protein
MSPFRIVLCAFFALFPNAGIGPILGSVANGKKNK